jgi:flavorubredoxin
MEMTMHPARTVAPNTEILAAHIQVPGLGWLAANAFLIRTAEPVLIDCGVVMLKDAFLKELRSALTIEDIRWIWLTHLDPDHIGALEEILSEAPRARVVTTFLGLGKLGLLRPALPPERFFLLNPGQALDVGDRRLIAIKPPTFDAPETTGVFDPTTAALFSADSFGALMTTPVEAANEVPPSQLRDGLVQWASVDVPWLSSVEEATLERALQAVRELRPAIVLSSHLPPAPGMTEVLVDNLFSARRVPPFVGPDQAAVMQMMQPS